MVGLTRVCVVVAVLLSGPWLAVGCDGSASRESGSATPAAERPAEWAQPIAGPDSLPNLHKVSDALYRGAQPDQEGFAELKALGIRTVVNLRTFRGEGRAVQDAGLEYVKIPMQAWRTEDEDFDEFLRVVSDPRRQPVFVHCRHGADRVGLSVAIYRVALQGWSKEAALEEMTRGGFGFHERYDNLIEYLRELDVEAMKRRAGLIEPQPAERGR
jgi:protein tyrosine/serine phosphatase